MSDDELRLAKLRDNEIKQAHTKIADQQRQLLDLRLDGEIDSETFAEKATELRGKFWGSLILCWKIGAKRKPRKSLT